MPSDTLKPDKKLAAICGLFCPGCWIYIAHSESQEKRREIAEFFRIPVEALYCEGCRAEVRYRYCATCRMFACAREKGIDFCIECEDYPCADLKEFQAAKPHRSEIFKNLSRIREVGYEKWFAEMVQYYSCPQCGTVNSAYDQTCRKCGAAPGCPFAAAHSKEIQTYIHTR
jgi:hypothetical protein